MSDKDILRRSKNVWGRIGEKQPASLVGDASEDFRKAFIAECKPGMTILDLGCGIGDFLHRLGLSCMDLAMFGCDFSQGALNHARAKVPSATFTWGYAHKIKAEDEAYDLVWCEDMLHFCPKDNACAVLDDAFRVLKKGGALYLGMYIMPENYPRESGWFTSPTGQKTYHTVWKWAEYLTLLEHTDFVIASDPVLQGEGFAECVLRKPA